MSNLTYSIARSPRRGAVSAIQKAALDAVEPGAAVRRYVGLSDETLVVNGSEYDLSSVERVRVLGAGKAAQPMAGALFEILDGRIDKGLVVVKNGEADSSIDTGPVEIAQAAHPVPDASSVKAAERIAKIAIDMGERDLALVVVAGGASALLTLPAHGISLEDLQIATQLLLRSGAAIQELNAVRRHLSQVKGGGLLRLISPARAISFILSDVVGDSLEVIGSGPTASDSTTFADAWRVLEHSGIIDKVPSTVRTHLDRGAKGKIPDTPKPGDPLFDSVRNIIVGSNRHAAEAAVRAARENAMNALLLTNSLEGEAREIGRQAAGLARDMIENSRPLPRPACLVLGGETTVTVRGSGKGGRNQELALSAAVDLGGLKDVLVVAISTDGQDGPTDAAGAVATGETLTRAQELGLDAINYLNNNDSYAFFDTLGDLIRTGPTRTNVADLLFVFAF
jgi:glycerate 2-kinase